MSKDEILAIARQVDPDFDSNPDDLPYCLLGMAAVEAFAALVASKASQDEREACRKECADLLALSARQARDGDHFEIGREAGHSECEAAIRARSAP